MPETTRTRPGCGCSILFTGGQGRRAARTTRISGYSLGCRACLALARMHTPAAVMSDRARLKLVPGICAGFKCMRPGNWAKGNSP
jgi:hypothetical protein